MNQILKIPCSARHKNRFRALWMPFLMLLFIQSLSGQSLLFEYENGKPTLDAEQQKFNDIFRNDATTGAMYYFAFDFDVLSSPTVAVNLPNGQTLYYDLAKQENNYGGRKTIVGRQQGGIGELHLAFSASLNLLTGVLLTEEATYSIKTLGKGLFVLMEYDSSQEEPCGTGTGEEREEHVPDPPPAKHPQGTNGAVDGGGTSAAERSVLTDECYIRVLVAYTTTVAANEPDPLGIILNAISLTNTGYINSGINQQLQLARVYETAYNDTGIPQSTVLGHFRGTTDGNMDEVHSERLLYRADLCALITNVGSGIAYTSVVSTSAFSCTNRTYINGFTFGHELGHNHSCQHDPSAYTGTSNYRGYGHPSGYFRTVMAYGSACGASPCTRVNEFSGPSNYYFHSGTGIFYLTGNSTQNNVAGHNNNNGTIVNYQSIIPQGFYANNYTFGAHEHANFSAEDTIAYKPSGTNKMVYNSASSGVFSASNSVRLMAGFHAKLGSTFTAYLEPSCTPISFASNNGEQAPTVAERESEVLAEAGVGEFLVSPNPMQAKSNIGFNLLQNGPVDLKILDMNGRLLRHLVANQYYEAGSHQIEYIHDGSFSGLVLFQLTTQGKTETVRVVVQNGN